MSIATRLPAERNLAHDDADRIALIRERIIAVGDRWRTEHPAITRNQNVVGLAVFLVSALGVVVDAVLYAMERSPGTCVYRSPRSGSRCCMSLSTT
jgi:hypothetical protein